MFVSEETRRDYLKIKKELVIFVKNIKRHLLKFSKKNLKTYLNFSYFSTRAGSAWLGKNILAWLSSAHFSLSQKNSGSSQALSSEASPFLQKEKKECY